MEGSGNSHRDICRDGGSSRIDAERCGDADTDSARERRGGQSPARGRPRGREGGRDTAGRRPGTQSCACLLPVTQDPTE